MTIDDLERCISSLLALAKARGVREISPARHDSYWVVPSPEWLDMNQEPTLAVGSLEADLAELQKLLSSPERASSVDLDRAAAALRLISDLLSIERL